MTIYNTSIKANEIKKFNDLALKWWDLNGPMRMLHTMNPLRIDYLKMQLGKLETKKQMPLLDVGCGAGIFSESAAEAGFKVTALDASSEVIEVAKSHAKAQKLNIDYKHLTAEAYLAKYKQRFSIITCFEMLEHVENPPALMHTLAELLLPNGILLLSTINRHPKAFLQAIVAAEFILNLLPKGTHHYAQFIRPSELIHAAKNAQLTLQDLKGISYRPLRNTFSLTENLQVNYLACFKKTPQ